MIAVDAMGGDRAPKEIIKGALFAAKKQIPVMLFGDKQQIHLILNELDLSWNKYQINISHSSQIIEMADEPSSAVRNKTKSSLVEAVNSVKSGQNLAFVGAGNSGAIMVAATFILGRQKGIIRPAIIGELPVCSKRVLCLDLGANTDCRPEYLFQFAQLGNTQAKKMGIKNPKIALLSNGHEEGKGSMLVKDTFVLLSNDSSLNFIGNIEPYGIFKNQADVVVSDGFSGNILLKTIEALAGISGVKKYASGMDVGGALLAGVNGTVVITHGDANHQAIERAIMFAFNNIEKENIDHGIFKKSVSRIFK